MLLVRLQHFSAECYKCLSKLCRFSDLSILVLLQHFARVMPLSNFGILYGQAFKIVGGHSILQTHIWFYTFWESSWMIVNKYSMV